MLPPPSRAVFHPILSDLTETNRGRLALWPGHRSMQARHGAMRSSADGRHRDRGRATERVRLGRCGARGRRRRCESPWTSIRREFTLPRGGCLFTQGFRAPLTPCTSMRSGTLEEVCTVTLHTANTAPSCSASTPGARPASSLSTCGPWSPCRTERSLKLHGPFVKRVSEHGRADTSSFRGINAR